MKQLKRIVADLTLDKQMVQDVLKKSSEVPAWFASESQTGGATDARRQPTGRATARL